MAQPYAQDLRARGKHAVDAGHTQRAVAAMWKIGTATVERYLGRWRQTGSLAPEKLGGHKKQKLDAHARQVQSLVEDEPEQPRVALRDTLAPLRLMGSLSA